MSVDHVAVEHEHLWHLTAVLHDDGASMEEYCCDSCDAVTFR